MKFLLINAYSAKNRGDAGIVASMIHLIRDIYPKAEISVMSSFWKENESFYNNYKVHSIPPTWILDHNQSSIKRYITGLKILSESLISKNSVDIKPFKEADVVISVGGGYLYSSRKGPLGVGLLNSLFHVWLAKKTNNKVIGFPQSVGPITYELDKKIVKSVLKKADTFISREKITTDFLINLGLENVKQIPDIGFILPELEVPNNKIQFIDKKVKIGLTLLDWRFAKKNSTETDIKDYVTKVADACKLLLEDGIDCHFYIFPQVTVGEGDSDLHVSNMLNEMLGKKVSTVINLDLIENRPEYLVNLYGKMDVFIGSRMHSTIFALAGNTPTIALAYQHKTRGTFNEIGLDKYVLDVVDFSQHDLYKLMEEIVKEENYPINKVEQKIKEIKKELINVLEKI
ncbi:polysaccharide pyruvyl transferase family protein [Metabacillus rhizolycopersici]|uniref:Polysaccharide pyruvyl transferase family protein n=1 Tax=Metabacillus rhizolycopersici TaxID=2875709 RepID=A0ABS7UL56_9BACI|nr:polysaccharide pyruvyl transferase family protein [Metabacillus rhizolycopersici]MBZ5749056.1 polysaccharide pyruvyl transferase family protein [Metabacillus rhizolycopersici]